MSYTLISFTRKVDNTVMEVLKLFEDYDLSEAHYSRSIGRNHTYITGWRRRGASIEHAAPVLDLVIKSARKLAAADLSKKDLSNFVEESGITVKLVARKAKVSRQAIYKALDAGLNDEQQERIENALRRIGEELLRKASRLKEKIEQ